MTAAEQLRALVKEATTEPEGKGPEFNDEWARYGAADDWLADLAPQLAELVADMGEALREVEAEYGPYEVLARLDALFSEEAVT